MMSLGCGRDLELRGNNRRMDIRIKDLSQEEADSFLKILLHRLLEDLREAFHAEKEKIIINQNDVWAESSYSRQYYCVYLDEQPYLLVGIDKNTNNISSFARIVDKPKGYASDCLKYLIEKRLISQCNNLNPPIPVIYSRVNEGGCKVFGIMKNNLPIGVSGIEIKPVEGYWSVSIKIGENRT